MPRKKKTPNVSVDEIREQLMKQREDLLEKTQAHSLSQQDLAKGDLVDQSTDLSEREMMLEMAETERVRLRNIDAALEMMEKNTYGVCEQCGEPIPVKRLLAVPTARHCVPCQEQLERFEMEPSL